MKNGFNCLALYTDPININNNSNNNSKLYLIILMSCALCGRQIFTLQILIIQLLVQYIKRFSVVKVFDVVYGKI